jgi:hypothetical protein
VKPLSEEALLRLSETTVRTRQSNTTTAIDAAVTEPAAAQPGRSFVRSAAIRGGKTVEGHGGEEGPGNRTGW